MLQALVTALLSGLFSSAIVFALNERRDRDQLMLQKAEAAYEAVVQWVENLTEYEGHYCGIYAVADLAALDATAEKTNKKLQSAMTDAQRLVRIYYPDLILPIEAQKAGINAIHALQTKHISAAQINIADIEPLRAAQLQAVTAGHAAKAAIAAQAREIVHQPYRIELRRLFSFLSK